MPSIVEEIVLHRSMLVSVARRRLHNDAWAEDAASETLMAALDTPGSYSGRSTVRTWLVGILKHKVADQFRRHARDVHGERVGDDLDLDDTGDVTGRSVCESRSASCDPVECLIRRQFVEHLERCMKTLPPQQARAVLLRDYMEEGTGDICDELGITANNLAVTLHRARATLRASLWMHGVAGHVAA
jgi:RNA polymerase sigma-70 factor (ECF subfamily)